MSNCYLDQTALKLMEQLEAIHGSGPAVARAIRRSRFTYYEWKTRGLSSPEKWEQVILVLRTGLPESQPEKAANHVGESNGQAG